MSSRSEAVIVVATSIVVVVVTSIVVIVGVVVVVITLMWSRCTVAVVGVRVVCGHVAVVLVDVLVGIGACGTWRGKAMWKK